MNGRLFDVPATTVLAGAACTWCASELGEDCIERGRRLETPHAQRWRDYWNATHDRRDQRPVYPAPWLLRGVRL